MKTIHRHIVSAVLVSRDQKVFMAFKSSDRKRIYHDCWHIPGGGVEENEAEEAAVVREVKEEVGLDISRLKGKKVQFDFEGVSQKETPKGELVEVHMSFAPFCFDLPQDSIDIPIHLNEEFSTYRWIDKNEMETIKLTPPSIELFKKLAWL